MENTNTRTRRRRKLSIDETWNYIKQMWADIAFKKEVLKDERSITQLKRAWLKENEPGFVGMTSNCFFCEAQDGNCAKCPGKAVDRKFSCMNAGYEFQNKPGAFYREILRLDEIRTAKPPEHVWKHGDVFEDRDAWFVCLAFAVGEKLRIFCLDELPIHNSVHPDYLESCPDKTTFFFNIKDIINEKINNSKR